MYPGRDPSDEIDTGDVRRLLTCLIIDLTGLPSTESLREHENSNYNFFPHCLRQPWDRFQPDTLA